MDELGPIADLLESDGEPGLASAVRVLACIGADRELRYDGADRARDVLGWGMSRMIDRACIRLEAGDRWGLSPVLRRSCREVVAGPADWW